MGQEAIYKCRNCDNEFKSREGGGFLFTEYRCVECDYIECVEVNNAVPLEKYKAPTKEQVGVCKKCGGELREDLKPMCPACRSRDVEEKEVEIFYD